MRIRLRFAPLSTALPYYDLEAQIGGDYMTSDIIGKHKNPPMGGSSVTKSCEHKFVHLETVKEKPRGIPNTYSILGWKRIDRFFCEKCLEQKEFVKTAPHYEDTPDWF